MKFPKTYLVAAIALVAGAVLMTDLLAQTKTSSAPAAAPAVTRVAVCDVVRVFANYEKAKDLERNLVDRRRTLKAEDERRAKQIESIDQELKELNASSKEFESRLNEMTKLTIDRETWQKFEQEREVQQRYRLTDDMYKEYTKVVAAVAKEQGFQVVLASDETTAEQKPDIFRQIERKKVIYADSGLDLTDLVVTRLNDLYKAQPK